MKTLQLMLIAFTFAIVGFSQLAYSVALCDETNYLDYIYNSDLTNQHIQQYGTGCNLKGLDLGTFWTLKDVSVILIGADLRFSDLTGANLEKVNLSRSNLTGANLEFASLIHANMKHVILTDVYLTHADLRYVEFKYADLTGTYWRGAKVQGTIFKYANLSGANLQDIDFGFSFFSSADFTNAKFNSATQFSEGFSPVDESMINIEAPS